MHSNAFFIIKCSRQEYIGLSTASEIIICNPIAAMQLCPYCTLIPYWSPQLWASIVLYMYTISTIINEFRCYEAKIEESEKAGSRRESNPGHLWLEPPVLCH